MARYKYEPADFQKIGESIDEISELLGSRPVSDKSKKFWIQLLSDQVPAYAAISILTDWLVRHQKAPTPAEVIKEAQSLESRNQERRKQNEHDEEKSPTEAVRHSGPEGEAFVRWRAECAEVPKRPAKWCWMTGLLYWVDGDLPGKDTLEPPPLQGNPWFGKTIGAAKMDYLRKMYGETPNPETVAAIREAVRKQLEEESKLISFSEFCEREGIRLRHSNPAAAADDWASAYEDYPI